MEPMTPPPAVGACGLCDQTMPRRELRAHYDEHQIDMNPPPPVDVAALLGRVARHYHDRAEAHPSGIGCLHEGVGIECRTAADEWLDMTPPDMLAALGRDGRR